jgi:exopolyphosphatase / guanosine-5'-triphosphate,3'-diphosphate pyrophosphatase
MPDKPAPHRKDDRNQDDRVAVIDIGSNSIRLVIFDRLDRTPLTLFNEKQMCGLGRGLAKTGVLNPDGKVAAIRTLARFTKLLERLDVSTVFATATAALRTAKDGLEFAAELEAATGIEIEVISGDEEARLAAMGVIAGMPNADGVVGDIGGGSLELVSVANRQHENQVSLPLGPFKFPDKFKNRSEAVDHIRSEFSKCPWLMDQRGKRIYAVGGAWRALAKVHMEQVKHPLHIVHAYAIPFDEALDFADLISRQSRSSLEKMAGLSSRRVDVIAHAALLMRVLLEELRPIELTFSSYGLREGVMFDRLDPAQRVLDPLLYSCRSIEARNSRFDGSIGLFRWTKNLFPEESATEERLRRASCLLSDFCWAEHPDYRAEHAFLRVLRSTMVGLDHRERVFLATVLHRRYGGKYDAHAVAAHVLDDRLNHKAELLGNALRLGQTLGGGAENVLDYMPLVREEQNLILQVPEAFAGLVTDVVERRLNAVAKVIDLTPAIQSMQNPAG